jgi:hypothetical protein
MNPEVRAVQARPAACLLAMIACALLVFAAPTDAAFPGKNGKIAYTDGDHLMVMNPDGTGANEILTPPVFRDPAWSADGSTLAGIGGFFIAFVKPDGSGYRTIGTPWPPWLKVSWAPDSTKLVFGAFSLAFPFDFIYTINVDGTDPRLLASRGYVAPKWSPKGDKIVFTFGQGLVDPRGGLYTMSPDGQDVTKIPGTVYGDLFADWSPDGQRIVFERRQDIYSIGVDGSNLAQLTSDRHNNVPVWSPDGTKIAFTSNRTPCTSSLCGNGQIYVMNADGSGQTQLTNTTEDLQSGRGFVGPPDWQPLPGPQRSDYRNWAEFCEAERGFLGDPDFKRKYGTNRNGANAFGKCVSSS